MILANILFQITDFLRSFNADKEISIGLMVVIGVIIIASAFLIPNVPHKYGMFIFFPMLFLCLFLLGYSMAVPDRGYFLPEKNLVVKRIPDIGKTISIYVEDTTLKINRMLIRHSFIDSFNPAKVEIYVDTGWNVVFGDHHGRYLVYDRYTSWQDYELID